MFPKWLPMILALCVSSCGPEIQKPSEPPPISGAVICTESQDERSAHAEALGEVPDDLLLRLVDILKTGVALIRTLDAGCAA
jgi:hypothetical protein